MEHLDWRTVMSANAETSPNTIKALDKYFNHFVALELKDVDGKPEIQPQKCVGCQEELTGFKSALFGKGGFEWGITHGRGHCRNCGWPAFGHHFIKDEDGKDVVTIRNVILQVHPDFVDRKPRAGRV